MCTGRTGVKWEFIHELYLNTVYGGRVESNYDVMVMQSYLLDYFNASTLTEHGAPKQPLAGAFDLPESTEIQDYVALFKNLPDFDKPSYFGLPGETRCSTIYNIIASKLINSRILFYETQVTLK